MDSDGYLDVIDDPVEEIYREMYLDEDMFEGFVRKRSKLLVEEKCMREEMKRKRAVSFLFMGLGNKCKYDYIYIVINPNI